MMNSNNQLPYTKEIPGGTLTNVVMTQPSHVQIQWPNVSGNTVPNDQTNAPFLRKIFG